MRRKGGICVVCVLFLVSILGGCAEMTEQQKRALWGTGIGAVGGAAIGAAAGGGKGAAIGAATGAFVGGVAGWLVGEYHLQQTKNAQAAAVAHAYTPQQGVVVKIDKTAATPKQLKPGDQVTLHTTYTVLAPPERDQVKVKEVRTILFNKQEVTRTEKDIALAAGTYNTEPAMTLPAGAAPGEYTVKTKVQALDAGKPVAAHATTRFTVGRP